MGFRNRLSLGLGLILLILLAGCDKVAKDEGRAKSKATETKTYARELGNLNAAIEAGIALSAKRNDDALLPLEVVSLYLERARLTGDYEDYRRAEAILDVQPGAGKPSSSHCLARARLHYTLHRLKQASTVLHACPPTTDLAEMSALSAEIAMYSGRYREAEGVFRALVNQLDSPQHYIRLALLKSKMGSPGEAAAFLEAAEKRYHGVSATMKAWLKLQRGLVALERGRLDEALAMYRLAADALPGWWLVDEHIAEVMLLSGDTRGAKALYTSVVERTQAPEFMDALAAIELSEGRTEQAKQLLQRAEALYEKRLSAFPEAAAGHALDHFLLDSTDALRALSLAQANFQTRSYGESAIGLAKAWILSGKPERAVPLIEAQLTSGWDTAEAHWILAQALKKLGHQQRADLAQSAALLRNSESEKMYSLPR